MMSLKSLAILFGAALATPVSAASQAELDNLARSLGVRLTIVDNRPANCPKKATGCFVSHLNLTIPRTLGADLADGRFQLYFSSVAPVIEAQSDLFQVRHVNGDLHLLEAKPGARIAAGSKHRVKLWTAGHFYSAYYPMPNMFLVSGNLQPRTVEATRPLIDRESGLEVLPFVAAMTDERRLATAGLGDDTKWLTPERAFALNASLKTDAPAADLVILPTPKSVARPPGQPIDLRRGVSLKLSGVSQSAIAPALDSLGKAGVHTLSAGPGLYVRITPGIRPPEGYRLHAVGNVIAIDASDAAGAQNGLRSLAQQVAFEGGTLRPLIVEDAPRLPFRGLHIDLARNFHSKEEVLKLIEQMGVYKLNKLHLHLADDEGWRLHINQFPELTEIGGHRCFDPSENRCLLPQLGSGPHRDTPVNGYLSQADYRDILLAAKARNIEVIPSLDMPGHSRAAIRSMEARYQRFMAEGKTAEAERFRLAEPGDRTEYRSIQHYSDNTLNVCLDSTYRFLDAVLDEVVALHAAAGTPLKTYHIGADETAGAWAKSPACGKVMAATGRTAPQLGAMFIERVSQSLARRGIVAAGWSDGMGHTDPKRMPANVQSNIWSDLFTAAPAEAHRHVNRGWQTIISVPNVLYLDVPYAPDPLERGYDWPARGTDSFKLFSFMPENLPANASVMTDIRAKGTRVRDTEPMRADRRIHGVQAQLWSETVRSDQLVDYMLFPRLLAFAERAWHRASWEPAYEPGGVYSYQDGKVRQSLLKDDWGAFTAKIPYHLRRLDEARVHYRIAPPGARIVGGILEANGEFPNQIIEYRMGETGWQPYAGPVPVSAAVQLRARAFDRSRPSRIVEVRPAE